VVGFGISTVEDVSKISGFSNGVVVGSALIKFIEKLKNDKNFYEKVRNYIRKLKRPLI
jgi:tryptophan synthase alpha chain